MGGRSLRGVAEVPPTPPWRRENKRLTRFLHVLWLVGVCAELVLSRAARRACGIISMMMLVLHG